MASFTYLQIDMQKEGAGAVETSTNIDVPTRNSRNVKGKHAYQPDKTLPPQHPHVASVVPLWLATTQFQQCLYTKDIL